VFRLFYAATNGLSGSPKLSLTPSAANPRYARHLKCRFFCNVSCRLLQHDTVDINAAWNLSSRIWFHSNQHEKLLVTYLCNEMLLFCYTAFSFSCRRPSLSFTLQLIWGNAVFLSVVSGVFTLSFVPRIVLTKLNNYIIPFFLIWRLYSHERNTVIENREWHCYYSTLKIALSVFITICIFLDAYNVHKSSNKKFAPVKNQTFRWTKNAHQRWIKIASLSTMRCQSWAT